jgi:hypothetical protein
MKGQSSVDGVQRRRRLRTATTVGTSIVEMSYGSTVPVTGRSMWVNKTQNSLPPPRGAQQKYYNTVLSVYNKSDVAQAWIHVDCNVTFTTAAEGNFRSLAFRDECSKFMRKTGLWRIRAVGLNPLIKVL